jgi:phosphoglycolate phosphatase
MDGNERRIGALILDFDGTLAELTIDFSLMKRRLAALAGAFLGEAPPLAEGVPALEWLDILAGAIGSSDKDAGLEFHSRGRLLITSMELEAAGRGGLFPFTRGLLASLAKRGVPTAVITRNCTAAVKRVVPEIESLCSCFLPRDAVPKPKPDPLHVLAACACLGVDPGRALVVGDHPLDIEAARRAGALSGAVASGRIAPEELRLHCPDYLGVDCAALVAGLIEEGIL